MASSKRSRIARDAHRREAGQRSPDAGVNRRDFLTACTAAGVTAAASGAALSAQDRRGERTQGVGGGDDDAASGSWGDKLKRSPFSLNEPSVPSRVLWIGTLHGTWREMGIQYGQRAGRDITQHWDFDWEDRAINAKGAWAAHRSPAERQVYRRKYLERAWKELSALSPELCDFFMGIAEGAAKDLDKAYYASAAPSHLKILYLNESEPAIHPNWDFDGDRPGPAAKRPATSSQAVEDFEQDYDNQADGCNGLWLSGAATANGHTLAQRAVQGGLPRTVTAVSYVAIPRDPNARVFWGMGRAGSLGGLGAGLLNDHGVCVLTAGSQGGPVDESLAPGIKDFILGAYGVIFSKTAREAAERMTVGTEAYRAKTGRKTVLRFRGANVVFGDPKEAYAVESNARHYLIRKPGDTNEAKAGYLVIANHFVGKESHDEQNRRHADRPMTSFTPGRAGSLGRYSTGHWWLAKHLGTATREQVMEFAGAHFVYDEAGTLFEVDPKTGMQTQKPETWCAHKGAQGGGSEHPLGTDGNHMSSVFDLTTREVWFVPAWTCHYQAWHMNWHYVDLKLYAEYREKVWKI